MSRYAEVHKLAHLRGAGDARPTALQIIEDEGLIGKLADKVFLVTGVSSGLGVETLRALHATGRSRLWYCQKVVDEILAEKREGGKIDLIELELDSFESIRKGANDFLSKSGGKLNVIVGNAGVMHTPYGKTKDGFETQFGTCHLGHFLLFQLLKDALLASATPEFPSRYVSVTSIGHLFGPVKFDDYNFEKTEYDGWTAYGQAKTANIWMANSIERHYGSQHLHATSVHPGGILEGSTLGQYLSDDQKKMFEDPEALRSFKSQAQGAATQVWAAVGKEWANKGGKYLTNCMEQISYDEKAKEEGMFFMANDGYKPWAYDEESEERLWRESFGNINLFISSSRNWSLSAFNVDAGQAASKAPIDQPGRADRVNSQ
ncbi:short-chain dehydrogenase [Coprinopsis sp. MPI-PUGE-AT-0042]|nr:short-chain dehydrogenase [Coprinopsis sp. MPI-PUGE-AT-0042]